MLCQCAKAEPHVARRMVSGEFLDHLILEVWGEGVVIDGLHVACYSNSINDGDDGP